MLISLLGIVIYPTTLFLAVSETMALNASLYLAIAPVLIVLLSALMWGDKIGAIGFASVVFGLLGALVLIFRGDVSALVSFRVAGNDTWAVISALAWACYCVSLPLRPATLSELPFLAILVIFGSLILAIMAVISQDPIPMPDTPVIMTSMIYFAVFPSILAFLAWNWGTKTVGPSIAAPYNNLVPFLGGILGVVFLNETVESYHLVGGGLIISGLVLNGFRR